MKKSITFKLFAAAVFCFGVMNITGCASIFSGGSQDVSFKSEPEGATVVVGGRELGKTPLTTKIDRKSGQSATIQMEGYKPQVFPLATTTNGWFWGNIIFGLYGGFSSSTDVATGAMTEYSPSFYNVTLSPAKTSSILPPNEVKSYVIANYKGILEELNTTPGQYVNSLWSLLKISPDKQSYALAQLKKLSQTNMDIVDFATKVSAQIS